MYSNTGLTFSLYVLNCSSFLLVTIFSMNVKVINGSGLPMWVLVAAFFIVNTGTLAIQSLWKRKQTSRQEHRHPQNHRRIPRPEQSLLVRRSVLHDLRRLAVHMGKALQIPAYQAVVLDRHPDLRARQRRLCRGEEPNHVDCRPSDPGRWRIWRDGRPVQHCRLCYSAGQAPAVSRDGRSHVCDRCGHGSSAWWRFHGEA
jgi:hypothetical protein